MFIDCRDEDGAAIVAELAQQESAGSPRQHKRTGRNPLPPELPRIESPRVGLAAPGLHGWGLIQGYLDHLPLYRIEKIGDRHGLPIARSTPAQWGGQLDVALQPLVDRLVECSKRARFCMPTKPRSCN